MTDIIFINPPKQKNGEHSLFNNAMLWMASYLINKGFSVKVFHLEGHDWLIKVKEVIETHSPEYCAISCKWWDTLYSSIYVADFIKHNYPGIKLVTGGNTASSFAVEILENSAFDYVIKGDSELPLANLLSKKEPVNTYVKKDGNITFSGHNYVQDNASLDEIFLPDNLEEVVFPIQAVNKYIWTGKGCSSNCFFCAAGWQGQKKLYNRKGYIYRDINKVISDCRIIGRFTGNTLMFDFDPMDRQKALYYEGLLSSMPKNQFSCNQFYFWYLPDKKLVDLVSEVFTHAWVGIDIQVFSEPLRKRLSSERIIKPRFFSDGQLEEIIAYISGKDNLRLTVSGLLGMPYETEDDIARTYQFFDYFMTKYPRITNIGINPVIVEPDSPLVINAEKYQLLPLRKTFYDFFELTRYIFDNNLLSRPLNNYYEYLKYFGMMRKTHDEFKLFKEFNNISKVLGNLIARNNSF